ncbi:MAG: dipeptide/oligopeptide/nickel ABC transporter ATP-binding protein [Puniceicoccales bacterium]|jgi:ABC-type dipeptide/oligopeptide/nickel transport system ATPase subunit|nr:dipeptide/oligopeptide/nickel ABC transporter ATP-binding protein [Puniceicoccales bacterium]
MNVLEIRGGTVAFPGPHRLLASIFRRRAAPFLALDGVSLAIRRGECWGLVGESGSGKTTLGLVLARLQKLTGGDLLLDGVPAATIPRRRFHRQVQLIFQSPRDALDPRYTVRQTLLEPLRLYGAAKGRIREVVNELLAAVQLSSELENRLPGALSGGQRQRVAIARSLAVDPAFLICDEVVSALDTVLRGEVVQLLRTLQVSRNLGMLFITHDPSLIGHLCSHLAILQKGKIVECGTAASILAKPGTECARQLLQSIIPIPH